MIYFVKCNNEYIKIGTTNNVQRRLKELSTGNPYPLKLLFVMKGSFNAEAEFHNFFKGSRHNGEWFKNRGLLKHTIHQVQSRKLDTANMTLEDFINIGRLTKMELDYKRYLQGKKKSRGKYLEKYNFDPIKLEEYLNKFKPLEV